MRESFWLAGNIFHLNTQTVATPAGPQVAGMGILAADLACPTRTEGAFPLATAIPRRVSSCLKMAREAAFWNRIERVLKDFPRRSLEEETSGEAAVLIPVLFEERSPAFLLTKRTEFVSTHKGQISFPGGIREPGDPSLLHTALRETREEIGISPRQVSVAGAFHDYRAVTGVRVTPFVGRVQGQLKPKLNSREVERILQVPITFFSQTTPRTEEHIRRGRRVRVYYYSWQGDTIWGLTARIIKDFVELVNE